MFDIVLKLLIKSPNAKFFRMLVVTWVHKCTNVWKHPKQLNKANIIYNVAVQGVCFDHIPVRSRNYSTDRVGSFRPGAGLAQHATPTKVSPCIWWNWESSFNKSKRLLGNTAASNWFVWTVQLTKRKENEGPNCSVTMASRISTHREWSSGLNVVPFY